jgi:hypothetical protein
LKKNAYICNTERNQLNIAIMKKYESFMVTLENENKKSLILEVLAKDTENAKSEAEKYREKFQKTLREKFQITNIEKKVKNK